jgi:hypothetical protein
MLRCTLADPRCARPLALRRGVPRLSSSALLHIKRVCACTMTLAVAVPFAIRMRRQRMTGTQTMTMKKLICRYAGVRRNFSIDLVSNSDITAHEFERWSVRRLPPFAATSALRLGPPLPRLHGTRGLLSAPMGGQPSAMHAVRALLRPWLAAGRGSPPPHLHRD